MMQEMVRDHNVEAFAFTHQGVAVGLSKREAGLRITVRDCNSARLRINAERLDPEPITASKPHEVSQHVSSAGADVEQLRGTRVRWCTGPLCLCRVLGEHWAQVAAVDRAPARN